MTLIVSVVTHDYAIQVSDRRLTNYMTGELFDSETSKAVMYGSSMVFGYTGHSQIGGKNTDLWLAALMSEKLSRPNCTLKDIVDNIRDKATEHFKSIQKPPGWNLNMFMSYKRHAFVGVGFSQQGRCKRINPLVIVISNFQGSSRQKDYLSTASDEFKVFVSKPFKKNEHFLSLMGQLPESAEEKKVINNLDRTLRKCIKRVSPKFVMKLICDAIYYLAKHHKNIGDDLMTVCLPGYSACLPNFSVAGKPATLIMFAEPGTAGPSAFYLPKGRRKVQFMPIIVFPGGNVIGGMLQFPDGECSLFPRPKVGHQNKTKILTDWIGTGSPTDGRRPAISEDYAINGWTDITGQISWPKDDPCPYYGYVVEIDADHIIINQIKEDPKYLILEGHNDSMSEVPSDKWFNQLIEWLVIRGMGSSKAMDFILKIRWDSRWRVIDMLIKLLRQPKNSAL